MWSHTTCFYHRLWSFGFITVQLKQAIEKKASPLPVLPLAYQMKRNRLPVKKCALTLSQKTFGLHRMSLYMPLIALYSSVRVRAQTLTKSQRWWLHSDSGKDEQDLYRVLMCRVSLIKAPRTPEMTRHVVPCNAFFPSQPVTHNHSLTQILHVTNVRREYSGCVCVRVCQCVDVGPLTGMEAACWTNSLTNVSTFPSSLLTSLTTSSLCKTDIYELSRERREGERREGRGKKGRGVGWQAAGPLALPSDSVYLPLAPWGFVSEESAMMNRPV